jgi:hypothetical protein
LLEVNAYNLGAIYYAKGEGVKRNRWLCVSKVEMSPITAKLKCPHGRGKDKVESEAVTEISGDGFGIGWEVRGGGL